MKSLPAANAWDLAIPARAAAKGAGGGEVFEATRRSTGETVAVKFTHAKDGLAEARVLSAARSAHLPRLFGYARAGDKAVLVTQWGGVTIPARPHAVPLACALVVSALRGIDALHALGRIHSDIHHHNVLADKSLDAASVLVIDAANAKKLTRGRWQGEAYYSDPQFMAPELQRERKKGELLDIDRTVDTFAATSLLVRFITGKATFVRRSGDGHGLVEAVRRGPSLPRTLDAGLAAVIRKGLAFDPAERFQTCGELMQALAPYAKAVDAVASKAAWAQVMEIYYPRERKALDVSLGMTGETIDRYREHARATPAHELVEDLRERALAMVDALEHEALAHYYGCLCMRMNVIGPPLSWNVYEANPDISAHVDAARDQTVEQVRGAIGWRFDKLREALGSRDST